jgi:hypothetical protein
MRISVNVTIELNDPEDWTLAFGVEGGKEIREDVKRYVGEGVASMGVFGNGEVQAEVNWR